MMRQHRKLDILAIMQNHEGADDVLQLAHIARPLIGEHRLFHRGCKTPKSLLLLAGELGEKSATDQQHIVVPFAQGRQRDRHHMQAVEQVLAEAPRRNLGRGIAVGCADDAHVDRRRRVRADPLHRACLQEAKHFCLQRQVHLANFVEKERASVRLYSRTLARRRSAGEGPFLVAEDLAFQQIARDGGTVDGNERPVAPLAELVKRLGAQFLSGATLARDENGGLRRRRALKDAVDGLHRERVPDEADKSAVRVLFLGRFDGRRELVSLDRVPDRHPEPVGRERLGQEIERAFPHRFHRDLNRCPAGDDDDFRRQPPRADVAQQVHAVGIGQVQIEHDHVGNRRRDRRGRLGDRRRGGHPDAAVFQIGLVGLGKRFRVLDDEHRRL